MVLRPGNNAITARRANSENMPPAPAAKGAVGNRLRSTLHQEAARRRRARATAVPRSNPKVLAEQAKRRDDMKPKSASSTALRLMVSRPSDIEMKDATSAPRAIPISLPKELARPQVREVSNEALLSIYPELEGVDAEFIREKLEEFGPQMLSGLSGVKASLTPNALPTEMEVILPHLASPPSHMIAVFGPPPRAGPSKPRKVTVYPIHNIFLAAHCSNLPVFPPSTATPTTEEPYRVQLPVRSLCLPSPDNYSNLASYLYHKNSDLLLATMIPNPEEGRPLPQLENQAQTTAFATHVGRMFTFEKLLLNTMKVHGIWQNACALGVFDDLLWSTIDLAWEVMLTALTVSSNKQSVVVASSSTN